LHKVGGSKNVSTCRQPGPSHSSTAPTDRCSADASPSEENTMTSALRQTLIELFVIGLLAGFATVPAVAQEPEVAATLAFTEGPAVDQEGNLYFSEMTNQRIMKLTPPGALSVYREKSNNANGLVIDPEGRLIAAEGAESNRNGVRIPANRRITRTELRIGEVEISAEKFEGQPLRGPNDVTMHGKGRIHF